jgi:histidinol dehydrogenase
MSGGLNKKLSEMLGKVDGKLLQAKLNNALELLRSGDEEEILRKVEKIDKEELLEKLNEFDDKRLKEMNIDKKELQQKISEIDMKSVQKLLGEHGEEIIKKIQDIIN